MTRFAALLAFLLALAFLCWALLPHRHVPYFRVASLRLRLRLRLHPGRGFASLAELWWYWGRFASFRESARCRPTLPLVQRVVRPSAHSVYLGRAQYRLRLRQTIQENILIIGRSRSGKSGWLARVLLHFGGAVVSATTKPDLFLRTSGLRARRGRRVDVFDPQRIGGPRTRSTVRFDPIPGCEDPSVAMRRGMAFTDAVRTQGTEADNFWSEQAAVQMPALFCAAALGGRDLHAPYRWVISGDTREPERILRAHGRATWADSIAQMRGAADKTGATVRMVLVAALKFMEDPAIACCVLPAPGEGFDIGEFLRTQGSLYLMADPRSEVSPVAPVFACLVNEIHWTACQLAGSMRGERHDPPLLLQLDEVAKICPLPVPSLLADSGGRGIMMIIACQGLAQIEERWGKPATRTVLDTSNQVYVSGIQDPDTLKMAADLCGSATWRERGARDGKTADYPVATDAMIRRLPRRRALVLRADLAPVITHLPMVWNDWAYRWARLRGRETARLLPAAAITPAPQPSVAHPVPVTGLDVVGSGPAELAAVGADHRGDLPGPAYPWEIR